jgi:hypothetical protein
VTVNIEVIARLGDIYSVEHVEEALSFQRDGELVINHIKEDVCGPFVGRSDRKVVNLSLEDNALAGDDTRIQAGFVYGGCEAKFPQDGVSVFLPESWGLVVALHCGEDRDDMTIWDWGALFVVDPPVKKGSIWADKETLLWRRGFSEGVRDVGAKDEHVLRSRNSIEQAGACLIHAVGVRLIKIFY